jgi:thioredoxin reductase
VLEKDRVYASTIQHCPRGKIFQAEPDGVANVSPLPIEDGVTKEALLAAWDELLQREKIDLRLEHEVLDVRAEGGCFRVTTSRGMVTALRVVLAPGTRARPRQLGVPGQELPKVRHMLVDAAEHRGQALLVVGGGDSAVEVAMALAAEPGNRVTLSYRQGAFTRIKPRNQQRIAAHLADGRVRVVFDSQPVEVRPDAVVLQVGAATEIVPNDFLYCLLGGDLPTVWLQQMGVGYVQKAEGWNPGPTDALAIKDQT